jgi:hypothetical protein
VIYNAEKRAVEVVRNVSFFEEHHVQVIKRWSESSEDEPFPAEEENDDATEEQDTLVSDADTEYEC